MQLYVMRHGQTDWNLAAVVLVGIDMLCNRLFPGANLFLGVF